MASTAGQETVEDFIPTSGRVTGPVCLVAAAAFAVVGAFTLDDGFPLPAVTGALLLGALAWAAVIRPRVRIHDDDVVLRNMLGTTRLPLAAIESLVIRQVLVIRAGERRFVNSAVGRTRKELNSTTRSGPGTSFMSIIGFGPTLPVMGIDPDGGRAGHVTGVKYADFVEERLLLRRDEACEQRGVRVRSEQQRALAADVREKPAWFEIALLATTTVAFVVSFFL